MPLNSPHYDSPTTTTYIRAYQARRFQTMNKADYDILRLGPELFNSVN